MTDMIVIDGVRYRPEDAERELARRKRIQEGKPPRAASLKAVTPANKSRKAKNK